MLFENDVPKTFWREVVNTIVYTLNRVYTRKGMDKHPINYGLVIHHQSSTLGYLEENVTLDETMILENLIQ